MNNIIKDLKHGKKGVAVWGLGYIGYTSMAYFARAGIKCLGYDLNKERVEQIKESGKINPKNLPNLNYWLGFDVEQMHKDGLINATYDWEELINDEYLVHLIAVPTEKVTEDGEHKPYHGYLEDVFEKLCNFRNVKTENIPLIIVESTLSPNILDENIIPLIENNGLIVGEDLLLGVAPRRDWFVDPDKTLKTIPRVVGGTTKGTTDLMADVLELICNTILKAHDHRHAAIVKSIENAYRQVEITLANQLSVAYPDLNMRDILKLAGTKWNMNVYFPGFGIGGYCIPLAPHYVLEGAKNPDALTLLKHSIEFDEEHPVRVANSLRRRGIKSVGILGIAYAPDLKVHVLSPALTIVRKLKEYGINVKVNDPYYTEEELVDITKAESFKFPDELDKFDAVLIVAGHMKYKHTNHDIIKSKLENCKLILDNNGVWKDIDFNPVEYHEAGDKNWLGLD